ncbi:MAG: glycine dehydrogenase (aminomethyl-transferring) [Cryomorphaceae bacterium]|nr:MAG: glycine dehydrogenase (aminomethyl-transferring) [Cryomorphaceae bacterium]
MSHHSKFERRHLGPRQEQVKSMLQTLGLNSMEELIHETIPDNIRLQQALNLEEGMSEFEYLSMLREKAAKNTINKTYIGMGYSPTIVPAVVQRNILENPGWYTAYTPYQAEIAQGRLEALLNFQTVVSDLCGLELANASLLDEATAAAEAMIMSYNLRSREAVKSGVQKFFVDAEVFPQTLEVLKTRAVPLGIELVVANWQEHTLDGSYFGAMLQYPNNTGKACDYRSFTETARALGILVSVATDLMSLVLLTPPGEWGADIAFGNSQRFGVPMGYGGPHAAFFATKEEFKRQVPGRIIGVSKDRHGNQALRMALQTREQHIKREKATSNICTAQALLAVMASMYAVYHGPDGLNAIASEINGKTRWLEKELNNMGFKNQNEYYFDTLKINMKEGVSQESLRGAAEKAGLNLRYFADGSVGISLHEAVTTADLLELRSVFAGAAGSSGSTGAEVQPELHLHPQLKRSSAFLTHEIFSMYHSESEMMRYMKRLENKDLSLTHSMISLGSCTMKLNAASELLPLTWPEFSNIHPYVPAEQAAGYVEIINELGEMLCEITGFDAVSFQPNSGAQGEYAGLMAIRGYHEARGEGHRNVMLIPSSAHGTNPASAVMAGMEVVVVKCDEKGNIDVADLRAKSEAHSANLSGLMVTYPSTHGVFEKAIIEINEIVHQHGGQVYMDGANMNAQVGLTNPGSIGADVCHLNLHKTFAIPHGGGGPGMGPICVKAHLEPFLGRHAVTHPAQDGNNRSIAGAHYGSALILLISYGYIKMLGGEGVTRATEYAILNANYIKQKLDGHYSVLYTGERGFAAHEMIIDCRMFKNSAGIEVADIAKRLIDYGFHAPTVSFPVAGTMMIEPTESESLEELDRFCEAMIKIRDEIRAIEKGAADKEQNVLRNAPHTAMEVTADSWPHPYSRQEAAYPAEYLRNWKYWAPVARVDNAYGDRNLICTCPSIESYETAMPA